MYKILVVDDDEGLRLSVRNALENTHNYKVEEAFDGIDAIEKVKANNYSMAILDVDMPRCSGLDALRIIKEHNPSIIILIVSAFGTIDNAVRAVRDGAYNYIVKPIKSEDLVELVEKAFAAQSLISDAAASAPVFMESGRKIIGNTLEMKRVFNVINRISKVDTPVLIRGSSGTGKELVARAIHFNSGRKDGKFVAINCSAIPENLFESELFGHEKGAFTGADQRKIGKFQYAEGGTLFLDEIGDLPLHMQVKLLRVLQEKVFTPVGSNREVEANVRIIAATNRPLEDMIKKNDFREDLFYRINVMPILLPALKDRIDDIDFLVQNFIKKFNIAHSKRLLGIAPDALTCMKKYDWPGNIRELENVIEHAFILENSSIIRLMSLPAQVLLAAGIQPPRDPINFDDETEEISMTKADASTEHDDVEEMEEGAGISNSELDFNKHKEQFEKEFIIKALKTFKGRINQTALHANIPKKRLLRKIEKYGIVAKDYADPK